MIYNLVYLAMLATWLGVRNSEQFGRVSLGVWCAILFFFVAFRFEVGCDWSGYLNLYDQTEGADFIEAKNIVEPAYALFFIVIHALDFDYPVINVISAAVFFSCLYLFCRRQRDPFAALVLFFPIVIIQLAMSGIRQASGLAILMLAFNAFVDGRRIAYCLLVVLASTFHTSAIIFLPYALVIGRRLSPALTLSVSLLAVAATPFVGSAGFESYQNRYIENGSIANGAPFRIGVVALAAAVFWFRARQWRASGARDYPWLTLMSGAMFACIPLGIFFPVIGDRIAYYLTPAQVAIFTRVPALNRNGATRTIFAIAPFVLLGSFQALWFQFSDLVQVCYIPYRNWLFDWLR